MQNTYEIEEKDGGKRKKIKKEMINWHSGMTGTQTIVMGYSDANWTKDKADRKSNNYTFFVNGGLVSCRKQSVH